MAIIIDIPLTDRFTFLVKGLLSDVVAELPLGWVARPLIKLLFWRLRRMTARFATTMARYQAGTLPPPAARRPTAPVQPGDEPRPPPGPRPLALPRLVGWVVRKIPGADIWAGELKEMLADPRLAAAVAGAPQLGGVLRPMCRMMAVRLPAWLRLPRRPRRPDQPPPARRLAAKHPPPPDWLVNEPGAILRADGTVWMRLGASTKWRPGDPVTLEEAQKFDRPRQIWPRLE